MNKEEHFIGKVTLKALITQNGKVLITRDARDPDIWELPGGRMNVGETLEQGLKREIKEELGVEIVPQKIIFTEPFKQTSTGESTLLIAYEVQLDKNTAFVFSDKEIAEIKWINADEIKNQKIYDVCLHALQDFFHKKSL